MTAAMTDDQHGIQGRHEAWQSSPSSSYPFLSINLNNQHTPSPLFIVHFDHLPLFLITSDHMLLPEGNRNIQSKRATSQPAHTSTCLVCLYDQFAGNTKANID